MSTIEEEQKMLDKIANAYYKAENKEMKKIWKEKWYKLVENVSKRNVEEDNLK